MVVKPKEATENGAVSATVALGTDDIMARLAAPFDVVHQDRRSGVDITYVTGEQVTRRLNEVLGVSGWSFSVISHGINTEADEVWCLGELVVATYAAHAQLLALVSDKDRPSLVLVRRQQFGSQKVRRSRSTAVPLDLGFDLKGATTDCLKKCASLIGVGLYLWRREGGVQVFAGDEEQAMDSSSDAMICADCGNEIRGKTFANKEEWSASQVAARGREIHPDGKPLCWSDIRKRAKPAAA